MKYELFTYETFSDVESEENQVRPTDRISLKIEPPRRGVGDLLFEPYPVPPPSPPFPSSQTPNSQLPTIEQVDTRVLADYFKRYHGFREIRRRKRV